MKRRGFAEIKLPLTALCTHLSAHAQVQTPPPQGKLLAPIYIHWQKALSAQTRLISIQAIPCHARRLRAPCWGDIERKGGFIFAHVDTLKVNASLAPLIALTTLLIALIANCLIVNNSVDTKYVL